MSALDEAVTVSQVAEGLVRAIGNEPDSPFGEHLALAERAPAPGTKRFVESVKALAQPFFESGADPQAAVRVRGAQLVSATPFDKGRPSNVLVEFDNHTVALMPVLPESVTEITVNDREIVAVSFERPSGGRTDLLRYVRWSRHPSSRAVFGWPTTGVIWRGTFRCSTARILRLRCMPPTRITRCKPMSDCNR